MKKIAQDKHCATFKNKDGHEIKVAIHKLSPDLKKQLDALPLHKFADGGDIADTALKSAGIEPAPPGYGEKYTLPGQSEPSVPPAEAAMNWVSKLPDKYQAAVDKSPDFTQGQGLSQPGQNAKDVAPPDKGATGDWGSESGSTTPADQSKAGDLSSVVKQPEEQQAPDQNQPEQAASPAPASVDPVAQQQVQIAKTPQEASQNMAQGISKEWQAYQNDVAAGHIAPKTYQDLYLKNPDGTDRSAVGKVGTIFGMLMGGVGSGLTHQPNALLELMNKKIDRDFQAQQQTAQNKYKARDLLLQSTQQEYQKRLSESQIPVNSAQAKAIYADVALKQYTLDQMRHGNAYVQQLRNQVANLPPGSPEALKAQAALASISQAEGAKNLSLENQAAAKAGLIHQLSGDQSGGDSEQNFARQNMLSGAMYGQQGAEAAKFKESHHIPWVPGMASRPVNEKDQAEVLGHQKLDSGINDLLTFAKTHSTIVPGTKEYNIAQTKVRKLQADIRDSVLNTVYREGEQPLLDKFINSNPAGITKNWKSIPQLETLRDTNNRDYGLKLKSLGYQGAPQPQGGGSEIKTMNGVQYQRVQGGWKKVK